MARESPESEILTNSAPQFLAHLIEARWPEAVTPGVIGVFFCSQTVDVLADAARPFDPGRFDPRAIRAHAEQFSRARFRQEIMAFISRAVGQGT